MLQCPFCGRQTMPGGCDCGAILNITPAPPPEGNGVLVLVREDGEGFWGWMPKTLLSSTEVARLLGVSPRHVAHLAEQGAFPNALRVSPQRGQRGFWRIPLWDAWLYRLQKARRKAKR